MPIKNALIRRRRRAAITQPTPDPRFDILRRARDLDRKADAELQQGRHLAAEFLAHRAAALRAVAS